ncbi:MULTISPECIES: MerR family transcriptional regulator [unclassified Bosea (in: a-proteobacteria)]|uniref:MerR family transcriptional regulator n=1 Tax=unclassified Bosea (in: a-proteobacteria) TaxID=2653178 RepID=UPI000F74EDA6|nr:MULTISPECIES: MerR family transcriptional regulator [unclassified Bosea (in: a-proteobacteria)]AZO77106.1 MerR family transcriptional regulator [Bosea sp. Tri-49]RXT21953.1 MerR family transcriptional regulator [Bosea sp. Tri-39]RXT32293.1 MerR family transcriptional regulator [Bosea sp. Tri-54]
MTTTDQRYTIGELARLCGVPVRRIRFYSDKGLLPPATRTMANYRVYSDADAARLDLIQALRAMGTSLTAIQGILARKGSLAELLALRLSALEAEIAGKRRIAATLRAALRNPEPTAEDIRRLWTMTNLSNADMRALTERFYDEVTGDRMNPDWRQKAIEAGAPELPDDPTPEQIDAFAELRAMLSDETVIASAKADAAAMWTPEFDPAAYHAAAERIFAEIRKAMAAGETPASATGRVIAQDWLDASAKAMKREPDESFRVWHLDQHRRHHDRSLRYQQLLATLRGEDAPGQEWWWINEAMKALVV